MNNKKKRSIECDDYHESQEDSEEEESDNDDDESADDNNDSDLLDVDSGIGTGTTDMKDILKDARNPYLIYLETGDRSTYYNYIFSQLSLL